LDLMGVIIPVQISGLGKVKALCLLRVFAGVTGRSWRSFT
jgi:hypothetical protein